MYNESEKFRNCCNTSSNSTLRHCNTIGVCSSDGRSKRRHQYNQHRPISETKERWKWRLAQLQLWPESDQGRRRRAGLWTRRSWYYCMFRLHYGCPTAKSLVRSRAVRIDQKPQTPSGISLWATKIHPPSFLHFSI